jgi:hypothetical protein
MIVPCISSWKFPDFLFSIVGLVVMPDTFLFTNRKKIISLAERYHLQTIYPFPSFLAEGGLISYGARRSRVRRPTPIAS